MKKYLDTKLKFSTVGEDMILIDSIDYAEYVKSKKKTKLII